MKEKYEVGDMVQIDIEIHNKTYPSYVGDFIKDRWYKVAIVYQSGHLCVMSERSDSTCIESYMVSSHKTRQQFLEDQNKEQMTELKVGMKIKLKERSIECLDWCKNTTYSKEYKIVYLNTFKETCGYKDNSNNIVYMLIEDLNFYFDIVEEKEVCNSGEIWKVGDKFRPKGDLGCWYRVNKIYEVVEVNKNCVGFICDNSTFVWEKKEKVEKIQQEEGNVKMENTDKEYKIGDEVFIDLEKFAKDWNITANRLSPDVPYKIFAYGNPKDPEKYYSRASDGSCFHFLGEHVDKAKTATLNKDQETEKCMTNEEEVTREIQQKLVYMGLSLPAIQDIMQMVNDACTESYQNGIVVGKKEMKMDLEKFIRGE